MTIQLLQTWNGNPAGIYTMDSGEESRLIGLGLARAWEPSIDGASFQDSDNIRLTPAQVAAANAAGKPVPRGTLLADPSTGQLYGQSDGAGGYEALGGGGGGGGGGSSGGGGSDRTAFTYETGVTIAYRLLTETIDGIVWTYSYDVYDRPIVVEALGGELSRTIAYDATTGFGTASGNIYRGQEIVVTVSQMAAIKTALAALSLTTQSPQFYVADYMGGRGLGLAWDCVNAGFRAGGGGEIPVVQDYTSESEWTGSTSLSGTRWTYTVPAWLLHKNSLIFGSALTRASAAGTGAKSVATYVNGSQISTQGTANAHRILDTQWALKCANSLAQQYSAPAGRFSSSSSAGGSWTFDITADLTVTLQYQLSVSGDVMSTVERRIGIVN